MEDIDKKEVKVLVALVNLLNCEEEAEDTEQNKETADSKTEDAIGIPRSVGNTLHSEVAEVVVMNETESSNGKQNITENKVSNENGTELLSSAGIEVFKDCEDSKEDESTYVFNDSQNTLEEWETGSSTNGKVKENTLEEDTDMDGQSVTETHDDDYHHGPPEKRMKLNDGNEVSSYFGEEHASVRHNSSKVVIRIPKQNHQAELKLPRIEVVDKNVHDNALSTESYIPLSTAEHPMTLDEAMFFTQPNIHGESYMAGDNAEEDFSELFDFSYLLNAPTNSEDHIAKRSGIWKDNCCYMHSAVQLIFANIRIFDSVMKAEVSEEKQPYTFALQELFKYFTGKIMDVTADWFDEKYRLMGHDGRIGSAVGACSNIINGLTMEETLSESNTFQKVDTQLLISDVNQLCLAVQDGFEQGKIDIDKDYVCFSVSNIGERYVPSLEPCIIDGRAIGGSVKGNIKFTPVAIVVNSNGSHNSCFIVTKNGVRQYDDFYHLDGKEMTKEQFENLDWGIESFDATNNLEIPECVFKELGCERLDYELMLRASKMEGKCIAELVMYRMEKVTEEELAEIPLTVAEKDENMMNISEDEDCDFELPQRKITRVKKRMGMNLTEFNTLLEAAKSKLAENKYLEAFILCSELFGDAPIANRSDYNKAVAQLHETFAKSLEALFRQDAISNDDVEEITRVTNNIIKLTEGHPNKTSSFMYIESVKRLLELIDLEKSNLSFSELISVQNLKNEHAEPFLLQKSSKLATMLQEDTILTDGGKTKLHGAYLLLRLFMANCPERNRFMSIKKDVGEIIRAIELKLKLPQCEITPVQKKYNSSLAKLKKLSEEVQYNLYNGKYLEALKFCKEMFIRAPKTNTGKYNKASYEPHEKAAEIFEVFFGQDTISNDDVGKISEATNDIMELTKKFSKRRNLLTYIESAKRLLGLKDLLDKDGKSVSSELQALLSKDEEKSKLHGAYLLLRLYVANYTNKINETTLGAVTVIRAIESKLGLPQCEITLVYKRKGMNLTEFNASLKEAKSKLAENKYLEAFILCSELFGYAPTKTMFKYTKAVAELYETFAKALEELFKQDTILEKDVEEITRVTNAIIELTERKDSKKRVASLIYIESVKNLLNLTDLEKLSLPFSKLIHENVLTTEQMKPFNLKESSELATILHEDKILTDGEKSKLYGAYLLLRLFMANGPDLNNIKEIKKDAEIIIKKIESKLGLQACEITKPYGNMNPS